MNNSNTHTKLANIKPEPNTPLMIASKKQWHLLPTAADDVGVRVDRFLLRAMPFLMRSQMFSLLRQGRIRRNGGRVKPDDRLLMGDVINIPLEFQQPLLQAALNKNATNNISSKRAWVLPKKLNIVTLYEDDDIWVINKPAGLACHVGSGVAFGLIEYLRESTRQPFLELTHRLDRETSGVLLIARSRPAVRALHEQFRVGLVKKTYHAVVHGLWPDACRLINAPLYKHENDHLVHKVMVRQDGKDAITHINVLARDERPSGRWSLLELKPETGRTHQLRVHCAHVGHPIIGDQRYADFAMNKAMRQEIHEGRMFLHASTIECRHPITQKTFMATAPWPVEFKAFNANDPNDARPY